MKNNHQITQKELENYLWGAAKLLRGLIDASDFKQYIFPLMFFKRLSDTWDSDYSEAYKDTQDKNYSIATANDRFVIPEGAHWNDVRDAPKDIGRSLLNAFQLIESNNLTRLKGVFGNASWTDKSQMPDETLKDLIEHFSQMNLSIEYVPEDELGNGYEYLIKQFADDSGHTAQEFYTNRTLVHLMAKLLQPKSGESIYDPTCGTGGMLISCLAEVKRNGGETRTIGLYGQEIINITASIARMNLVIHGVSDFKIVTGNTLSKPSLIEADKLKKFDVVLANPPYSIKKWDRDDWLLDKWGRNFLGTPPQGNADFAFFQHILKSMSPIKGRCAILYPLGILERHSETDMRRKLIESDLIECVIGLGKDLFYNSPMESCIVICRNNKPINKSRKILFIQAVNEIHHEPNQSFLKSQHQEKILNAYNNFKNEEGFSAVVEIEEILKLNSSLSIRKYVQSENKKKDLIGVKETWKKIDLNKNKMWKNINHLSTSLEN